TDRSPTRPRFQHFRRFLTPTAPSGCCFTLGLCASPDSAARSSRRRDSLSTAAELEGKSAAEGGGRDRRIGGRGGLPLRGCRGAARGGPRPPPGCSGAPAAGLGW